MRVSYRWLQEFVPVDMKPEDLADRLTLVGLNVESVERPWRLVRGVVAARIESVEPHPTSQRLKVVRVRAREAYGDEAGGVFTVVTGAPNARAGTWVPFATPGARLADGRIIGIAEFGGVRSEGMCCSAGELALPEPEGEPGLLELDPAAGWTLGQDVSTTLELDDAVLDLDLTPNYAAHCQSVLGVAREVSALLDLPLAEAPAGPSSLRESPWPAEGPDGERVPAAAAVPPLPDVFIEDEQGCARYVARFVRGVRVRPSPLWMRRRLQAAGVRPISNVVDVTNYVMVERGQPLHAFDLSRLRGGRIGARAARPGERLTTLDGVERELTPRDLVIADGEGPVGLAGVMGGLSTEVRPETTAVLIESGWFDPRRVGGTARRLGLLSEASGRFEKGVDPAGCRAAADRAAALIQALAGGEVADRVADVYPSPRQPLRVPFDVARTAALLGVEMSENEALAYLARLGMRAEPAENGRVAVLVPTYRPDVTEPVDLAEEIGRLYGLNRIPAAPLPGLPGEAGRTERDRHLREVVDIVRAAGFSEVVTFSFQPRAWIARLGLPEDDPRAHPIAVANPLSEAQEVMRTTLLPSLLDALAHNRRVRRPDASLFEVARVYLGSQALNEGRLPEEPLHLGLVAHGRPGAPHWQQGGPAAADFFFGKGVVEEMLRRLRVPGVEWRAAREAFLHPGRAAHVLSAGRALGWIGEVHPRVLASWDLSGRVVAAELDLDAVLAAARHLPDLRPIPRHPAASRDLAVVLPVSVKNAEAEAVMREAGGELLRQIHLFDVYAGEHVAEGSRSLAYRLVYQADDRTLTDEEVEALHGAVRDALARRLGGVLRS